MPSIGVCLLLAAVYSLYTCVRSSFVLVSFNTFILPECILIKWASDDTIQLLVLTLITPFIQGHCYQGDIKSHPIYPTLFAWKMGMRNAMPALDLLFKQEQLSPKRWLKV